MAGIGIRLNRIFEKNTLTTDFLGFAYSTVATVAPMLVIIINLTCMGAVLGFDKIGYAQRELFSCTMLYIFIFALLTAAPFNAVLSRYMSDVIYEERYEDIRPCYYLGMMINLIFSCLLGIPFCIREHLIGKVSVAYTFAGFCGYVSLVSGVLLHALSVHLQGLSEDFLVLFSGDGRSLCMCRDPAVFA